MGKGSKAPEAPDAYETASAEAQFNRVDTYSPSGSGVRYGYTDSNGNFVQGVAPKGSQAAAQTVESPWEKSIREMLQPASLGLTQRMIADNVDGMPAAARVGDRFNIAKSIFDRNWSMMKDGVDQSNSRLLTNLQARGLPVGGEAFNEAYGAQQKQTQDTLARLAMDADIAAGQEQSRQFGLDSAQRSNAIAEIMAAMGGSYNPPNATPSGAASGVNYSGLVGQQYQNEMAQYNAQQQQKAQTAGAAGSLIASALPLMKCSRDFKNVGPEIVAREVVQGLGDPVITQECLTDAVCQMPVHVWSYKPEHAPADDVGETHIGPMAEDFHALTGLGDGKSISVIDAFGVLLVALRDALTRIDVLESHVYGKTVH